MNKTLYKELENIVYKLLGHDDGVEFGNGYHDDCKEEADEAIDLILNIVVERLPKSEPYGKAIEDEYTEQWVDGYNRALGDIKEMLK